MDATEGPDLVIGEKHHKMLANQVLNSIRCIWRIGAPNVILWFHFELSVNRCMLYDSKVAVVIIH